MNNMRCNRSKAGSCYHFLFGTDPVLSNFIVKCFFYIIWYNSAKFISWRLFFLKIQQNNVSLTFYRKVQYNKMHVILRKLSSKACSNQHYMDSNGIQT